MTNRAASKAFSFNAVYFFKGGSWHYADPSCPVSLGGVGGDINALVARLERAGYPAVKGSTAIGAPEGSPQ